ncbi:MAG: hypothetical protein QMD13_06560 [Candidatus Bathyarchaeia archaeon]|nr:hypothetical protein [Candidatus Bathyarchaeia archaeon]
MPELEIYLIIILALVFTAAYSFGSRYNYKIQKKIWKTLSEEIKPYSRKVAFQGLGSSGFKIACKPTTGQITKLEISIVLMSREIPLYYFLSKYMGKHDTLLVKSNFEVIPNFSLEIVKKGTKLHRELVEKSNYTELQHEKLSECFFLASSNPDRALEFLSNRNVVQELIKLNGEMNRLSMTSEEPHLLLSCPIKENVIQQLLSLAFACGKALEQTKSGT